MEQVGGDRVALVEYLEPRDLGGANRLQHIMDVADSLAPIRRRRIDDMHEKLRLLRLFECRPEGRHQVMGKLADEPDGIGEHHRVAATEIEPAKRRIEGGEQPVLGEDAGAGQPVEQGRFSGVRVAHQGDHRHPGPGPRAPAEPAAYAHLVEALAHHANPLVDETPIRLELRLARPAQADPPFLALQVRPSSYQPGGEMLELRELHLELALEGARALREYVEDEGSPVVDPALDMAFEVALLGRAQRVVEEDDFGLPRRHLGADLVGLAGADEELGVGWAIGVAHGAGGMCPGRRRELPELVEHASRRRFVDVHQQRPFTGRGSVEHQAATAPAASSGEERPGAKYAGKRNGTAPSARTQTPARRPCTRFRCAVGEARAAPGPRAPSAARVRCR